VYLDVIQLLLFFNALGLENDVGNDLILKLDSGALGPRRPDTGPSLHLLDLPVDLLVRHFQFRSHDWNALERRQVNFGPHLDLEIERHRALLRQLDLLEINVGLPQAL